MSPASWLIPELQQTTGRWFFDRSMSLDGFIRASNGAARRAMPGVRIALVKVPGVCSLAFPDEGSP